MAWFKKEKDKNKDKQAAGGASSGSSKNQPSSGGSLESQRPDSAALRAQALANARTAREAIGEETLQKIASAIRKKQESPIEQAKIKIAEADADRVAEEILSMLETRH